MAVVVDEINDKHMGPWAKLCQMDKTDNTPLTPFLDAELLHHNHLNLSNEKLKSFGYQLHVPTMSQDKIEEVYLHVSSVLKKFSYLISMSLVFSFFDYR